MNMIQDHKPLDGPSATSISHGAHASRRFSIPTINITPVERFGRVALGALGALAGAILLMSAGSVVAVVLEVLLIAAGLDLVITGALGHCPLYGKLGYTPTSLRRPQ